MQKSEFLSVFESVCNTRSYTSDVVEKIKSHGLPVIVFGASRKAELITKELNRLHVDVLGYAIDEEYYKPNQTYLGLPVFNFNVISHESDKYVFVLGVGEKVENKRRIDDFLNDEKIISYRILRLDSTFDYDYIVENQDKFFETYSMLSDDLSHQTMTAYMKTQISDDPSDVADFVQSDEYFNEITRPVVCGGGFVDCGAYDGDTVEGFINFASGNYKKIFAIEPDPSNFEKLKEFVNRNSYKNIECFNCGVWNEKGTLYFNEASGTTSRISENGSMALKLDTIDNIVGDEKVTLIKMDIEGSELNALKGAVKTLKYSRPVLAISVYHRQEDLITIPQFIKSIYKNCKFYIRKYDNIHPLWELDLYAVPD